MHLRRSVVLALSVLIALVGFGPTALAAHTVDWQGINWNHPFGDIDINTDGNLEVTATDCFDEECFGTAHDNTPQSFRDAPDHSVTVWFEDPGPGMHGAQIWIEKEGSPNAAYAELGAFPGENTYTLNWWNVDTDERQAIDTGIARTAGVHSLTIGKRADGTVDFYVDANLVFTTSEMNIGYIGDVYLASHSISPAQETAVFIDFEANEQYELGAPNIIETLCVSRITGAASASDDGSCGRWELAISLEDDPTLCINRVTGGLRVTARGCTRYELPHILSQDGELMVCHDLRTNGLRAVMSFTSCARFEQPAFLVGPDD